MKARSRSPRSVVGSLIRRTPPYRRLLEERNDLRRECLGSGHTKRWPGPVRDDLSYVFVVTYGRSGSTLLLGILNSIPGWLVRGENAGSVYHLFQHFKSITERPESRRREVPLDSTDAWFGFDRYPRKLAIAEIRQLVLDTLLRPERDTRVTGFKEIRWQQPDLLDYLRFLQRVFPGAKFVFNTRAHVDVAKSKWWARAADPLAEVARVEAIQAAAAEQLGDAAYRVHFDNYLAEPAALRGLFEWLGEEFDEQRVRSVMAIRHSY